MTHLEFNHSFTFNARFSFHCLVIHLCYTPLSILNLILEQRCHCMTMARMTTVRQVHFALVQWDVFG